MTKYIFISLIALLIISCKSTPENSSEETAKSESAFKIIGQDTLNLRVPDEEDGGEMLLGKVDREGLEEHPFGNWFKESYEGHLMDTVSVENLGPMLSGIKIKAFMGSWCEDSQREIPALFKILDQTGYDQSQIKLIAMTHDKDTPQNFEKDLNIEYVPTIIFYKDGEEMDRIVEYTQLTLEKDMITILSGEDYIHAYEE